MIIIYFYKKINMKRFKSHKLLPFLILFSSAIASSCNKAEDTSRITVAGGSITEIIFALGQQTKLIAVDITSNFPKQATELPSIGYVRALSAEGVLSLLPSLILGENDMGPAAVMEQLSRVGIDIKIIPEENTAAGIIDKVSCIANILDMSDYHKDLVLNNLRNEVNNLNNIVKNDENPKKVMFILGMESGSPTVGGKGTSADGFIKMTGGINVMSSFEGWKPVSTESIIEASPDFIIISNRGLSSFKTVEKLGQHPTLVFTPASKKNNIIALDGMAMLGFGPRTISSAKEVALRYISKNE